MDIFGTKAKRRVKELELELDMLKGSKEDVYNHLVHQLRQMDQFTYNLYQVAPDWKRMQPIVARMYEVTERRMKNESDRVRNLMVDEIKTAYTEPKQIERWK